MTLEQRLPDPDDEAPEIPCPRSVSLFRQAFSRILTMLPRDTALGARALWNRCLARIVWNEGLSCPIQTTLPGGARTHRRNARYLVIATLCLLLSSCQSHDTVGNVEAPSGAPSPAPHKVELRVLAASSLTDAFRDFGRGFEAQHPGCQVVFNFGASSLLATAVKQGSPGDLFASADWQAIQPLSVAKLVGAPQVFAHNTLVIVVPPTNPAHIRQAWDLARHGVRLVVCDTKVPIGYYTRLVLYKVEKSHPFVHPYGYGTAVLANTLSKEPNVRSLLTKVELGEADAAIVYASDATSAGGKVRSIPIPATLNTLVEYPIAVLHDARQPDLAQQFEAALRSPAGQGTLKKWGFLKG